ncbi:hypothetical protein BH23GEM4_BH23GEM4_11240 [soil metagenome]
MFRSRTIPRLSCLLAALALAACGDTVGNDATRLSLLLTDAPGDLAEATVRIDQIYLQGNADEDPESGRLVLYSGGESFDLLTLSGGKTAELASGVEIPAGTYSQLRMVISEASIKTLDGKVYSTNDGTLQTPSFASSGLKIKLPGGSVKVDGPSMILVVDFDAGQSFGKAAGNSGRWVMHPVVTATNLELSGGIVGSVALAEGVALPACGGAASDLTRFVPQASAGEVTVSGTTAADGTYAIRYVAPDDYTLGYEAALGFENGDTLSFDATASPATVSVASGAIANANYLVSAASCKAAD